MKLLQEPFYDLSFSSHMEQCASCTIESDSTTNDINKEILFKIKPIQLSCVRMKIFTFENSSSSRKICYSFLLGG